MAQSSASPILLSAPKEQTSGVFSSVLISALKSLLNDLRGQPLRRGNTEATNVLHWKVRSEGSETSQAKALPTPGAAQPLFRNPRKQCGCAIGFLLHIRGGNWPVVKGPKLPGKCLGDAAAPEQDVQCAHSLGCAGAVLKRPLFKVTFLPAFLLHTLASLLSKFSGMILSRHFCILIFFSFLSDELWEENRWSSQVTTWENSEGWTGVCYCLAKSTHHVNDFYHCLLFLFSWTRLN